MDINNGSTNQNSTDLLSRNTTPHPFTSDWHHQFGAKLCAFPRYLVLPLEVSDDLERMNDGTLHNNFQFWPDLATFVEGECWSALMYYPGASRASVCVIHWQDVPRWEAVRFDDEDVAAKTVASSYEELVRNW